MVSTLHEVKFRMWKYTLLFEFPHVGKYTFLRVSPHAEIRVERGIAARSGKFPGICVFPQHGTYTCFSVYPHVEIPAETLISACGNTQQ